MCFILHCLFTSILLQSIIALFFMEQSGMGIHNKWMCYRRLWPSIAILVHGHMTQISLRFPKSNISTESVKWMKKSNEKCFCSEKHYLCSCCSSSVASPSHLATSLLEVECGHNSLLMYICKWKWGMTFLSIFSSMYGW